MSNNLTLYGISEEMEALEEILEQDHGEVTEEYEELENQILTFLNSKVDGCVGVINRKKDLITLAKEQKRKLDSFIKKHDNGINKFSEYVETCLTKTNQKSFNGNLHTIKMRKPTKVVEIYDEKRIPAEFIEVVHTTKILKSEIKKEFARGVVEIAGARLVDGKRSLQIGSV